MYPRSEALDAVPERASLITLNASSLREKVEANPWVKGARVTKNWDSGIVAVEVEERRPLVDAEVGGSRVVLAEDGTELPGAGGARLSRMELDRDQLEDILEAVSVLRRSGMRLDSVDAVGSGGVEATVEGRRVVLSEGVGEGQARALKGVMRRHPEQDAVFDVRSPGRVVVGGRSGEPLGGADGAPRG